MLAWLVGTVIAGAAELGPAEPARSMPRGFFIHQSVVVENRVYVLGGGGGPHVCFTTVAADGSLAPWQATTPIPEGLGVNYATVVAHGRCLYLLGGGGRDPQTGRDTTFADVAIARVRDDGTLGAWEKTAPLPEPRRGGAAVVAEGFVYYVGGEYQRRVFYAPIEPSGLLGEWRETQRLISNRTSLRVFAWNRRLYAVGGAILIDRDADTVFRTSISPDGSLGKWGRTTPLPTGLAGYGGVQVGREFFLFGGRPTRASVYTTRVEDDGHLAPWRTLPDLPFAASTVQAVLVRDAVYLTGGMIPNPDGYTATVLDTVYRVPVRQSAPAGATARP